MYELEQLVTHKVIQTTKTLIYHLAKYLKLNLAQDEQKSDMIQIQQNRVQQKNQEMKVEQDITFEAEIKLLYKKFNVLDKPNTKILYEFCQFDAERTYKVLSIAQTLRSPLCIIDYLIKNSQKSEDYLDAMVKRYDLEIGAPVEFSIQKVEVKKASKEIIKLEFEFFAEVPDDTIGSIMSYLDPYSLKLLTFTNSSMQKIGKAQALSQLYREICKVLFATSEPVLPFMCRFSAVQKFVLQHPDQYFPYWNNFKNAVTNNLRSYIWKMQPSELKLNNGYYKEFGSYQNLFLQCPRLNMNGYYLCKHKYVKVGEKNATHFTTPIIVIYYFRYLRFLEDGTVIYHVCNKKLKPEQVLKYLGKDCATEQQPLAIVGEYMQCKGRVFVKAVKNDSVFCYELEINSTGNRICNQLKVINYRLELIDNSYMTQTLFAANPHKEDLLFEYVHNHDIKAENGLRIQACSL